MQLLERAIQLGRTNHLASMVSGTPLRRLQDKLQLHPERVLSTRQMTPALLATGWLHENTELLRKIDQKPLLNLKSLTILTNNYCNITEDTVSLTHL